MVFLAIFLVTAAAAGLVAALLINIFQRKQEAKNPYIRFVDVGENTTDPAEWGKNWPREYDQYKKTVEATHTDFGGGDVTPPEAGDSFGRAPEKAGKSPWLTRLFAGYAFALDYRDRRGHAYMLWDQEVTKRVTMKTQPGSCLHCHASIIPAYRALGSGQSDWDRVYSGFEKVCAMSYKDAHDMVKDGKKLVEHPVSCVDCHDSKTMELRVTRPAFIVGIKAYKQHQDPEKNKDYDVNRDATRQEMRSYVCGQCHVEYYFKGDKKVVTYPWANGLKVEDIEKYYDDMKFTDWVHAETKAPVLKAQHPEFEVWNQGIHARSGVACADCHMPYQRQGALKVSDHWVRSPLLMVNRSCQTCHHYPEEEIKARVHNIQTTTHGLLERAAAAYVGMLDAIIAARKAGSAEDQIVPALKLQRKAQWRLDFVAAENSMGFHAPQEVARILAEAADYARQGEIAAIQWRQQPTTRPATQANAP